MLLAADCCCVNTPNKATKCVARRGSSRNGEEIT